MRAMFGRSLLGGLLGLLVLPATAGAAGEHLHVPAWSVGPFVLLLLAIAVLPLAAGHFWHRNRAKALVAALISLPVAVYLITLGPPTGLWVPHPSVREWVEGLPQPVREALSREGTHHLLSEVGQ